MKKILLLVKRYNNLGLKCILSPKHMILVIALIIGLTITVAAGQYSTKVQNHISENLLRLHVIANSDSIEDQNLKLEIRDAIINEMADKFKISKSIDETKEIALNSIDIIESIAKEIIKAHGKEYSVKVSIEDTYFPTKYYGDVVLPSGIYEALKVQIGDSKGSNWWCVLFPPLCFVDATNGTLPESSKERLKSSLTQEEYLLITSVSKNDNIPIKIKFKSVEIWQQSKHKVQVAINNLF